jgi:hypothetical protein
MTSPSPKTLSQERISWISLAERTAPGVSKGLAGTQEGAMKKTRRGSSFVASIIHRIPSAPRTFAISWGSEITTVVPMGKHSLSEFLRGKLGTLDVHVRINKSRDDVRLHLRPLPFPLPRRIRGFAPEPRPDPRERTGPEKTSRIRAFRKRTSAGITERVADKLLPHQG